MAKAAVALVAILGLLPVLFALAAVFDDPAAAVEALAAPSLWRRFGTSLLLAAAAGAVSVPVGLALAWLFARTDLPGRGLLFAVSLLPLFLPPLVHALTWGGVVGLRGPAGIIVVYAVGGVPLVTLLAAGALEQIGAARAQTMLLLCGRGPAFRDEMRQALPAALIGALLAAVFVFSDYAVADYLTSVGPKVSGLGDTLYAHFLRGDRAGEAAAALPAIAVLWALLAVMLRSRRRLGAAIEGRHARAEPWRLGRARGAAAAGAGAAVVGLAALPFALLAAKAGSLATIAGEASKAAGRFGFTAITAGAAATVMLLVALPLALAAPSPRRRRLLDLAVVLPFGIPAILTGVGLIRMWNRPVFGGPGSAFDRWFYEGAGILVAALAGRYLAFAYLPLTGALERIGPSLGEAARMAGAGAWRRTFAVLLPPVLPAILLAWGIACCFALRELDSLQVLSAGQRTLPFWLYSNVVFAPEREVAALALLLASLSLAPATLCLGAARAARRVP